MNERPTAIKIGTRGSALARWQADYISELLRKIWVNLEIDVRILTTQGDRVLDTPLPIIGGKGIFTAELETSLRQGDIDCAVHSLKDLPTENPIGLIIAAVPQRAAVEDVLISRNGYTLDSLPQHATVGTSSRRRSAQLLRLRSDLKIIDIRGNIDTRIRKALDSNGVYDAIILAAAGVERLTRDAVISDRLPLNYMLPAPGQGALAVQCRADTGLPGLFAPLNHLPSEISVTAERAFLAGLGGGCSLPVAAYGSVQGNRLTLQGRVTALDGSKQVDAVLESAANIVEAQKLGYDLAQEILNRGGASLLESIG